MTMQECFCFQGYAHHRRLSTILLFFLGFIRNHSVQGLDTMKICPTRTQSISSPDANAVISHQQIERNTSSCTLTLEGLRPNGYIAIKGASRGIAGRTCIATLHVGGIAYCVEQGTTVYEPVIKIDQNGKIELMAISNATAFGVELITNCEYCIFQASV